MTAKKITTPDPIEESSGSVTAATSETVAAVPTEAVVAEATVNTGTTGRFQSAEPNEANTPKSDGPFANTTPPRPEDETRRFPQPPPITPVKSVLRPSPESFDYEAQKPKGTGIGLGDTVRFNGYAYVVIGREPNNVLTLKLANGNSPTQVYRANADRVERLP